MIQNISICTFRLLVIETIAHFYFFIILMFVTLNMITIYSKNMN